MLTSTDSNTKTRFKGIKTLEPLALQGVRKIQIQRPDLRGLRQSFGFSCYFAFSLFKYKDPI